MNIFFAGLIGCFGLLLIMAGVHNQGPDLFTALTNTAVPKKSDSGSSAPAANVTGGGTTFGQALGGTVMNA